MYQIVHGSVKLKNPKSSPVTLVQLMSMWMYTLKQKLQNTKMFEKFTFILLASIVGTNSLLPDLPDPCSWRQPQFSLQIASWLHSNLFHLESFQHLVSPLRLRLPSQQVLIETPSDWENPFLFVEADRFSIPHPSKKKYVLEDTNVFQLLTQENKKEDVRIETIQDYHVLEQLQLHKCVSTFNSGRKLLERIQKDVVAYE